MTDDMLTTRLGDPATLAAHAAANYRRATWVGRHPRLVFGVLPVPLALAAALLVMIVPALTLAAVDEAVGGMDDLPRSTVVTLAYAMMAAERFVPAVLVAALYARLAVRHAVDRRYLAAAAVQVAAFSGSIVYQIASSDVPGESVCFVEFAWWPVPTDGGWTLPLLAYLGWSQVITQLAVPAAAAGLVVWAARRRGALTAAG